MLDRKRNRLEHCDYSQAGYYFVTICVDDKKCLLGRIVNGEMKLSSIGEIAKRCWEEIPNHFQNVKLDPYIVMPNHIHGIIIIQYDSRPGNAYMRSLQNCDRTKMLLSKIIHGFKASVTRQVHHANNKILFRWQKSFYDHIIRSEVSLDDIREYIVNNPLKWELDRNYVENR